MANFDTYGGLYNWYAATDPRNISASGWRVPEEGDLSTLWTFLSSSQGGKLKAVGTTYWDSPNTGAVDSVGFEGRGAGYRIFGSGEFLALKIKLWFWTVTDYGGSGISGGLEHDSATFYAGAVHDLHNGLSIRLIKNTTTLEDGQLGTYIGNDGTEYLTVCIGTQEWLAENLRETKWRTGASIAVVTGNDVWAALTSAAMTAYENDGVTDTGAEPVVPTPDAYGTRYELPFVGVYGRRCMVLIKELNYTGASEEITGAIMPTGKDIKGDDDRLEDLILRSSVKLSLFCTVEGQFRDLFTYNWRKFIVEIYKDDVLNWVGFLTTDFYSEPWTAPPYTVTIEAHDGLGQLKNIDFYNSAEERLTGKVTLAEVISNCLYKILPLTTIHEAINIVEEHQTSGQSLLTHIAVQAERFYIGDVLTCYDVLLEMLKICNAQIFQKNGEWWIVSIGNRGASFTRRILGITTTLVDSVATFEWAVLSEDTYNPVISIEFNSNQVYWWADPTMTKLPAWKQFTVRQDLGLKESMFNPRNFTELGSPDYDVFLEGATTPFSYFNSPRRGDFTFDEYTVVYRNSNADGIRFSLGYFEFAPEQKIKLEFNFENKIKILRDIDAAIIGFRVLLVDGATTYYLTHNVGSQHGIWQTTEDSCFAFTIFDHKLVSEEITTVISDELPADGFVFFDIEAIGPIPPACMAILIDASAIKMTMTGFSIPDKIDITTHIDNNKNYIPDIFNMMFGDFIDVENNVRMYAGGLWYVAGVDSYGITSNWHTVQKSDEKQLVNVIADEIGVLHIEAAWMISGQIHGELNPSVTIYEPHAEKYMIMTRFTEDLYGDEWDVDLVEVSRSERILITEDGNEVTTEDGTSTIQL